MNPLIKKILIALAILIVLFVAYSFFFGKEPEAPLSSETPDDVPAEDSDLLSLLLQLKSITLSDELLADATFATLQDFTVELAPEPVGRRNPFAAIGSTGSVAPTASTSTTTP